MSWPKQQKKVRSTKSPFSPLAADPLEPRWLLSTVSFMGDPGLSFSVGSHPISTAANVSANALPGYQTIYLTSDTPGLAPTTDPQLLNPWGMANAPFGPFWVSDNNAGVSTIYDGTGASALSPVGIPLPSAPIGGAATGVVFNGSNSFKIGGLATNFIFATEQGLIAGWTGSANAATAVNRSSQGAVYKGLAMGTFGLDTFLYATNFHSGRVEIFDGNFNLTSLTGTFTDPNADIAAGGYAPFNINNINGQLYVTYAKQDADKQNDVGGTGNGIVDIFNTNGIFVKRLITGGPLDSPWGMTIAPQGFGPFTGDLLIANFRDGHINAFDPNTGAIVGTIGDGTGNPITIPGIWDIQAGTGSSTSNVNNVYFTAGFGSEQHGLFGSISVATLPAQPTATLLTSAGFVANQPVTLTAAVTGSGTGLVSFEENGTLLGSAALDRTDHASITISTLGFGLHHLTATFSGQGPFAVSTSPTLDINLNTHAFYMSYVNQVYADLLGRTPDSNGLSYWTSVLETTGSAHELSVGITTSTEYLSDVVEGFYQSYLGRSSDPAGLNDWVANLQAGATVEQVRTSILGSQEYYDLAGGTSASFVTRMFQDTLGRNPDPDGLNAWVTALDQGQLTRAEVSVQISGSLEGRNRTVDTLYRQLLRRPADPAGLTVWGDALAAGNSETLIVQSLVESTEYQSHLAVV